VVSSAEERGNSVRTVLVCVRTPLAAQAISASAQRLGVSPAIRTAVSAVETMARLTERAADVVLADVAVARPDPVAFTRRVRQLAPRATIVLFGPEDLQTASAVVAAGARGVIRGVDHDLVTAAAKALMLVCHPMWAGVPPLRSDAGPVGQPAPTMIDGTRPTGAPAGAGAASGAALAASTAVVPLQRAENGPAALPEPAAPRRPSLTERELQVLRGMSEGKSNAEIGRELYVSEDTVKTHARRLFRKLGARDRAHAVASAFRAGLVS
jgi:DNA-binding NarL/FixJ family response regulator